MKNPDYYYIIVDDGKSKEKSLVSLGYTHNLNDVIRFESCEEANAFAQKHLADKQCSVMGVLESKQ